MPRDSDTAARGNRSLRASRTSPAGHLGLAGLVAACALFAAVPGFSDLRGPPPATPHIATIAAEPSEIARLAATDSEVGRFYRSNGYRPLWSPDTAQAAMTALANAAQDGLDPADYGIDRLRALAGDPGHAAEFEVALSLAYADFVRDLRTPPGAMTYVDAQVAPQRDPQAILAAAAAAPLLPEHLAQTHRMHPLYEQLRAAVHAYRTSGANPSGLPGASYEQLLFANMDRLRALPADPGSRYVLVDTASARLWMYEHGRPVDTMRVVVGKARLPTPSLAGLIRFTVRNPYWNLPPDLIRERAARVVRDGTAVLEAEDLEVLSDWSDYALPLDPAGVDWPGVARGAVKLRMRQRPGPHNMMGAAKFMFPNRLGIYLHDTPEKAAFLHDDRRLSSGCVRLEDAARFERWLFGGSAVKPIGLPEERFDLPTPVPVYILYLTAMPGGDGIAVHPDRYGLDRIV